MRKYKLPQYANHLHMMGMRKHIDRLQYSTFPATLHEKIKISRKCHRITRNIKELTAMILSQSDKKFDDIFVESLSRWVDDDKPYIAHLITDLTITRDEYFRLTSDEVALIIHLIELSIDLRITDRIFHKLYPDTELPNSHRYET